MIPLQDIVTCSSHEDLGTADALRLVHSRFTAENIMVVSSDLLVDINQVSYHVLKMKNN